MHHIEFLSNYHNYYLQRTVRFTEETVFRSTHLTKVDPLSSGNSWSACPQRRVSLTCQTYTLPVSQMWVYLCAASGAALRCERLDLGGAGFSAGQELKMLSESSRGASGLVLKNRDQQTTAQSVKSKIIISRRGVADSLSEDNDRSSLFDVLGSDAMCDVVCCVTTAKVKEQTSSAPEVTQTKSSDCEAKCIYLRTVTLPLLTGRTNTGSDTRMGLNWKRQPKHRALSLKKDTETMGRAKMCKGSTWDTMQPPGW